jgi:hypothetical protein
MSFSNSLVQLLSPFTAQFAQALIAIRDQSDVQVFQPIIEDRSSVKALAELVSTDRRKPWKCRFEFFEETGASFCTAVIGFHRKLGFSSLTALDFCAELADQATFALLLSSVPTIQTFVGQFEPKV